MWEVGRGGAQKENKNQLYVCSAYLTAISAESTATYFYLKPESYVQKPN